MQLAIYAVGAAIVLTLLFRIPRIGGILRGLFSVALLAFGIAAMVGTQAAINIAVATVSVPTKGLSLPLISAGGSGLVITCAAMGLLASVLSHVHPEEGDETQEVAEARVSKRPQHKLKHVDENVWSEWTTA